VLEVVLAGAADDDRVAGNLFLLHWPAILPAYGGLFRLRAVHQKVTHQRAAVGAMDYPRGVELELVAVAAQAVVLRPPVVGRRLAVRALAALAVIGQANDVFHRSHI